MEFIKKEKEKHKVEVGDFIVNSYNGIWFIVKDVESEKYTWVNVKNGLINDTKYKTIEDLLINEFEKELNNNKTSALFTVYKQDELNLVEIN